MSEELLASLLDDSDEEGSLVKRGEKLTRRTSPRKHVRKLEEKSKSSRSDSGKLGFGNKLSPQKQKSDSDDKLEENFFKIRIKNASISSSQLSALCEGMQKVSILSRNSTVPESGWLTMGVIVEKSSVLKSANGNEYIVWKMHDLRNCTERPRKVLLFGEASKCHWKLQKGSIVALLSPQVSPVDAKDKDNDRSLKVTKSTQILPLGVSQDFGTCKGRKQDGLPCSSIVNQAKCEMCVYHAGAEARRLAARRGTFNQPSTGPPGVKKLMKSLPRTEAPLPFRGSPSRPAVQMTEEYQRTLVKGEKEKLSALISKSTSLGARLLTSAGNSSSPSTHKLTEKANQINDPNMKSFMQEQRGSPKKSIRTPKEDAAMQRALAILQAKKQDTKERKSPRKRKIESEAVDDSGAASRSRVLQLLAKRSKHEAEAEELEIEMEEAHLNSLEKREAVEEVLTQCMELKDLRVFSCQQCGYTARSRSERCIKFGHSAKSHLADKRFFRCKSCKGRATAYGMLPTKPCVGCGHREWERVAMQEERKLQLENENLQLRGEERTFLS